jgi:hypothetical protein
MPLTSASPFGFRGASLLDALTMNLIRRIGVRKGMGTVDLPPTRPLSAASRMKMHLRLLTINGHTYRIVTLRPGTEIVFSTNFFHGTWHIVTSQRGARLLARLL